MVQYLVVKYDRRRRVYIDGDRSGFTNRKLRVEKGEHTVDLGDDKNYRPKQRRLTIENTSVGKPMMIEFERVEADPT